MVIFIVLKSNLVSLLDQSLKQIEFMKDIGELKNLDDQVRNLDITC